MPPRKSLWYKRDGTPFTYEGPDLGPGWVAMMHEVERHLRDPEYKRVGLDVLDNGLEVSTVWLGLDHRYTPGRPLIFETMIFVPCHKEFTFAGRTHIFKQEEFGEMARYSTLEEAQRGHKFFVKKYKLYRSVEQVLKGPSVDKSS